MLKHIVLTDFLSYGPGPSTIPLEPLNILIGPNGSGKSNFIEALAVLRAVPRDLPLPIREGGGVDEWLWRSAGEARTQASVEIVFAEGVVDPHHRGVRHVLTFGSEAGAFVVLDERIESEGEDPKPLYFGYDKGLPIINTAREGGVQREIRRTDIDRTQSILSQRRDPESYPEVTKVGDLLKEVLIYRSWSFGPQAPIRSSCRADVQTDRLQEDFSNLPARLAVLKRDPRTKRRLLEALSELAPGYRDIEIIPEGGRLQLYLTEGDRNVPAHRLSDGTLRYLALLAILLEPGAARLVAIEEPELGLHPDVFPALRDLMIAASEKVQLVVTTHSTQLIDAMTDHPESVVVCEKHDGTTSLSRLDAEEMRQWREFGSLGTLWMSGRLGGTRW